MHKLVVLSLLTALGIAAVETRAWRQTDFSDFEKGTLKRLSLRSDGTLALAPEVKELLDPSIGYLWATATDSKGNIYAGGGSSTGTSAKLYQIDANSGKSSTVADLEGMEIHALAVDSKDAVYAATAPDGKVYKIRNGGKAEVFFDPKVKYIWALVFAPNGDLFIGTGDKGEIFRVTPNGQGSSFFKTDETHARSLAVDSQGNLIVGTEPNGLVLRITPKGEGFVLYQTSKREVTAVATARDGSIYAAAVGIRGAAAAPIASPAPAPPTPPAANAQTPPPAAQAPRATAVLPAIAGGSELYKIEPDGYAHKIWSHATELAYSIAIDAEARPVISTGNHGGVYRIDSAQRFTLLANLPPTQVTQVIAGKAGALFAVTGNIGKLYQIGPNLEKDGVYESDLLDAGSFTYWGRLAYEGSGQVKLETRSGNLNDAHKNWSDWAATTPDGRVQSPAARFLEYRLTLNSGEATSVDLKYQAKNIAPVVELVEATPPNYKFPAPAAGASGSPAPSATVNLPAIGHKRARGSAAASESSSPALSYAKGFTGVRWSAVDENGDSLVFRVEIRGVAETQWKLLREKVREHYYSWDSTAFADGEYVVRVTASDAPSNTPEQALTATAESEPFLIDNGVPAIEGLNATSNGAKLNVSFTAKDALSNLARAEYSLNGGDWTVCEPTTRLSDAKQLNYSLTIDRQGSSGEFTIAVRVTDEFDNQRVSKITGR